MPAPCIVCHGYQREATKLIVTVRPPGYGKDCRSRGNILPCKVCEHEPRTISHRVRYDTLHLLRTSIRARKSVQRMLRPSSARLRLTCPTRAAEDAIHPWLTRSTCIAHFNTCPTNVSKMWYAVLRTLQYPLAIKVHKIVKKILHINFCIVHGVALNVYVSIPVRSFSGNLLDTINTANFDRTRIYCVVHPIETASSSTLHQTALPAITNSRVIQSSPHEQGSNHPLSIAYCTHFDLHGGGGGL